MDRIRNIPSPVIQKRSIRQHADAALVLQRANVWLSDSFPTLRDSLSAQTFLGDGTLVIECANSADAQECQAALPHLKIFLREECGFAPVRAIRLMRTRKKQA